MLEANKIGFYGQPKPRFNESATEKLRRKTFHGKTSTVLHWKIIFEVTEDVPVPTKQ